WMQQYISNFDSRQLDAVLNYKQRINLQKEKNKSTASKAVNVLTFLAATLFGQAASAQQAAPPQESSLLSEAGIIITITLILIPILGGIILMIVKALKLLKQYRNKKNLEEADQLAAYIKTLSDDELETRLKQRKAALDYQLQHNELSGNFPAEDEKGLININTNNSLPVVAVKKKALKRPAIDPKLA